jgi:hypothetical protein
VLACSFLDTLRRTFVQAPDLAAIRVSISRRETDEVAAWLLDPRVPWSLKQSVVSETRPQSLAQP